MGRLIPNFTGRLLDGSKAQLIKGEPVAYVVAMTSASCPLSRKYGPSLARLAKECEAKNIRMVFVNASPEETLEEKTAQSALLGKDVPYFDDSTHEVAQALGAKLTTEVFVLDRKRTLVYRGALDDQYGIGFTLTEPRNNYVRDCLTTLTSGGTPEWMATEAPGCVLSIGEQTVPATKATYSAEISRIMQRNCVPCHHAGGSTPFSLETYDQVKGRAAMIKYVVEGGIMPPWFADGKSGESPWRNDMSLPKAEKATLLNWIADGTPEGDKTMLPTPLKFESGWKIGEPDAVFSYPKPFKVPAEGVVDYQIATVPTNFTEDKWVQGIQVMPSARAVVHHVLVFVRKKGEVIGADNEGVSGFFGMYVPGNDALIYPDGLAKKIPAGASLKFQIHYSPNGTEVIDQTKIGLKFADKPPVSEVFTGAAANLVFAIPPGAPNHEVTSAFSVSRDIQVLSFLPHMHIRGKAARYEIVRPSGSTETVLNIPRYDFNWQLSYDRKVPLTLEKGSRIRYTAWFDNSANNPGNPDPTRTVRWGEQTFDEMQLGYFEYIVPGLRPGEDAGIPADPLVERFKGLFMQFDKNGDGVLTEDEVPQKAIFERMDADKDGKVTIEEAIKVFGG